MITLPGKQTTISNIILFTLLACLVAAFFYINSQALVGTLSSLSPGIITLIFATIAIQMLIRTKSELMQFKALDYNIPYWLLFITYNRQNILNYLPMKAGTLYTAIDLKGKHQVSLAHFSSILIAQHVILVAVTLMTAGFFLTTEGRPAVTSVMLIICGCALLSFLWFRLPIIPFLSESINSIIRDLSSGIAITRERPGRLTSSLALRASAILFMTWRLMILFDISDVTLTFGEALLMSASVLISLGVSLTPAGLGIREILVAFTSEGLGVSATTAVLVSLLDRAFVMLFSLAILVSKSFLMKVPGR